jgi:hypothetical protein
VFDGWYDVINAQAEDRLSKLRRAYVLMARSSCLRCFTAWRSLCVGAGAKREGPGISQSTHLHRVQCTLLTDDDCNVRVVLQVRA